MINFLLLLLISQIYYNKEIKDNSKIQCCTFMFKDIGEYAVCTKHIQILTNRYRKLYNTDVFQFVSGNLCDIYFPLVL